MANLNNIKLSSDDILKKQFRVKVKGYDSEEVDSYLDQIISDYDTFESIVEDLYGQIGKLQRELMDAKKQSATAINEADSTAEEGVKTYKLTRQQVAQNIPNHADESDSEQAESTNMAIIQRISTLERKVYNLEQHVYGLQK